VSSYEPRPRRSVSFGDVCCAEFLHDVFVRADARVLRREEQAASKFWRNRVPDLPESFPAFLAAGEGRRDEDYVLAHGAPHDAVVLSDDCVIESALGRDDKQPKGRILMAPVIPADERALTQYRAAASLGVFALDADEHVREPRLVQLRRCFMVRAGDFAHSAAADMVRHSLTDQARAALAARWTAYAARRGPLVAQDNARKLTEMVAAETRRPVEEVGPTVFAIAKPVVASWVFEGSALERAGAAWDARRRLADGDGEQEVAPDLRDLATTAAELRAQLEILQRDTEAALAGLRELGF
jgi:hypothetical protein